MPYLIGVDEAGYGPNIGPLVISATMWRVCEDARSLDLYKALHPTVAPVLNGDAQQICIADSKLLYKPRGPLLALERGIYSALALSGARPRKWRSIWGLLQAATDHDLASIPWYQDFDCPLPLDLDKEQLTALTESLRAALGRAGIEFCAIRSTAIFPQRFNQLVAEHGTKGAMLSCMTLELLAGLIDTCDAEEPVSVVCDKHGGRNDYRRHLQIAFPDYLVRVLDEGHKQSRYCFGPAKRQVEVCFRVGGEAFLPTALASMASKYLRELAMRAVNDFWSRHVDGLRPTAGYYRDAQRFKGDVQQALLRLRIAEDQFWRYR